MMAAWRAALVLASLLTACSATHGYGYGYGHRVEGGDYDPRVGPDVNIVAKFETGGIRGEICFYQAERGAPVQITVKLQGLDQYEPHPFEWMINMFPVQFGMYPDFPCSAGSLGGVYSPTGCPPNVSDNCVYGNLGERLGLIQTTEYPQVFTDSVLNLYGPDSPIGRSIVLRRPFSNRRIPVTCANIEYQGISLQTLRAGFNGNLSGDVILRRKEGRSGVTLNVDLYTACNASIVVGDPLNWSLRSGTCENIGPIYGSDTHEDEIHHGAFDECSRDNPRGCPPGDLTTKCGPVLSTEIAPGEYRYRAFCIDNQLGLLSISDITETVLVFETAGGVFVDCRPWQYINQHCARVHCTKRPRIHMDILFFQNDPGDRTHVRSYITGLDMEMAYLQVRRDPITFKNECAAGGLYDKESTPFVATAVSSTPTGDALPVGTMQFKISDIRDQTSLVKQDTTSWLPLFGPFSIVGRSVALVNNDGVTVACCNIMPMVEPSPDVINSILSYQERTNVVG